MLNIITLPSNSLREPSKEIDKDFLKLPETQKFIDEMIPMMYKSDGVGLASPQVGKNIRICVISKEADKKLKQDLILVNPAWERTGKKTNTDVEGCLSVPDTFGKVKRFSRISVKAWNRDGEEISFEAKKFLARVIQHECDHLDGILFVDKAFDICKTENEANKIQNISTCSSDIDEKTTRL
jgi:peptide deformylase